MSKVIPLIAFGMTFVLGGAYWVLWDDSQSYLDSILIEDEYYELISFGWRMIPAVIIMVGVMCLIAAGVSSRREGEVRY